MKDRLDSALKGELSQYQMVNSNYVTRKSTSNKNHNNYQHMHYQHHDTNTKSNFITSPCHYLNNISNFVINEIGNREIRDVEDVSEFFVNNVNCNKVNERINGER